MTGQNIEMTDPAALNKLLKEAKVCRIALMNGCASATSYREITWNCSFTHLLRVRR